jgi:hypothetical protein
MKGAITGDRRAGLGGTIKGVDPGCSVLTQTLRDGPEPEAQRTRGFLSPTARHNFCCFEMVFDQRAICTRSTFHLIFFSFMGSAPIKQAGDQRIIGRGLPHRVQLLISGSLCPGKNP